MAEINLGRVQPIDRGVYSPTYLYKQLDFVSDSSLLSYYACIQNVPSVGTPLSDELYFRKIASNPFIDDADTAVNKVWSSDKVSEAIPKIDDEVTSAVTLWSSEKISEALGDGAAFNYVEAIDPAINTDPEKANATWLNNTTGEIFACINNTVGENVWVGQKGTVVAYLDDGSALDGLTFASMVAAGKYDNYTDTGYFGEVPSTTLLTGDATAAGIGLTAGVTQHSSEGWLKFYVGANAECNYYKRLGELPRAYVIYIAKKPYRNTVSWDDIYARGAVYASGDNGVTPTGTPTLQDATVVKGGKNFSVRLMTGVDIDPMDFFNKGCTANVGGRSEWNQLFYRVHTDVPTCPASDTQDGGPQIGANWTTFSNADLVVGSGDGRVVWTQETNSANPSNRAFRGNNRLSSLTNGASSNPAAFYGWRPALVLVA